MDFHIPQQGHETTGSHTHTHTHTHTHVYFLINFQKKNVVRGFLLCKVNILAS